MNTQSIQDDPDFISIDDPKIRWPTFVLSMLRIGRVITAKEKWRSGITATQISKWMERAKVGETYKGREIRENFEFYNLWLTGGGIQISAQEMDVPYRGPRQYYFTFTRLDPPKPPQIESVNPAPDKQPEPIASETNDGSTT